MGVYGVHILNGISLGMLLFLVASGFTLIFGLMGILNLSHGTFYLLAGYIAVSLMRYTNNFILTVLAGIFVIGILGMVIHQRLLRYTDPSSGSGVAYYGNRLIFGGPVYSIWGGYPVMLRKPAGFQGKLSHNGEHFLSLLSAPGHRGRCGSGSVSVVVP